MIHAIKFACKFLAFAFLRLTVPPINFGPHTLSPQIVVSSIVIGPDCFTSLTRVLLPSEFTCVRQWYCMCFCAPAALARPWMMQQWTPIL